MGASPAIRQHERIPEQGRRHDEVGDAESIGTRYSVALIVDMVDILPPPVSPFLMSPDASTCGLKHYVGHHSKLVYTRCRPKY